MKADYITKEERLDFNSYTWRQKKIERINFLLKSYASRRPKSSRLIKFIFNRKQ